MNDKLLDHFDTLLDEDLTPQEINNAKRSKIKIKSQVARAYIKVILYIQSLPK